MLPILALAAATAPIFAADNPITFDFVPVGTTSAPKVATVHNTGTGPLVFSKVALSGRDLKDFKIASDSCTGASLVPGATCAVGVTFAPRAAGTRFANLYFIDNTPCRDWINLAGSGTDTSTPRLARAATCESGALDDDDATATAAPTSAPAPVSANSAITLPSAAKCVSRRTVTVGLKAPAGQTFRSVKFLLRGKVVKTLKGRAIRTKVSLKGLPRGRFTLEVRAQTAAGRSYTATHHYVTCVASKS